MRIAMVGLGRMGANLARRLMRAGHEIVGFDVSDERVKALAEDGATPAGSLAELVAGLSAPRVVWVMLPAGEITSNAVTELASLLGPGDVIIDGGNSYYRDDVIRARTLSAAGIHYVDVGTSGGVWGLERGYCLMIGGESEVVDLLRPIFETIAPGVEAAERTAGRVGEPAPVEHGYLHCGPAGAGHFVKMVHNGIEYGLMAAYAEGLNILKNANAGLAGRGKDAESAPMENAEFYQYSINLPDVVEVWRRGSVVGSWLLDLTASAMLASPTLEEYSGRVSDSGEGRWTAIAAVEEGVPAPTLTTALFSRFGSRDLDHFTNQVLSAMRMSFGGHAEKPAG